MTPSELRPLLRGVIAFAPTPFREDGAVDLDGLASLCDGLASLGGPVAVLGAVGEYSALDLAEYAEVMRTAGAAVGGRVPLLVGIGQGTRIASRLATDAAGSGADGLLIDPFWFAPPSSDGLVEHYRAIGSASGLGLIVFSTTGQVYGLEALERLAELDAVVALKDEWGDLRAFAAARERIGSRWAWINGMAELQAAEYAVLGADAFTSGLVNVAPGLALAVRDAAADARWDVLASLVARIRPFATLRSRRPGYGIAVIKEAIALLGGPGGGRVRPPLSRMRADDREELATLLPSLGAALPGPDIATSTAPPGKAPSAVPMA
jgi:5-dehydro-4-deoxyglucarate dehydratase